MDQPKSKIVDPLQEAPPVTSFKLRMWTYDIAREQCPTLDQLRRFAELTESAGYNALGLYMEHRFAFECTPWAHGVGCVTPEMVRTLQSEFPRIQFIPFLNLLGHCEGFIYTEHGKRYREEQFKGLQACPSNPAFVELCVRMVDEAMEAFSSTIIHLGGDETKQLGYCPSCAERIQHLGDHAFEALESLSFAKERLEAKFAEFMDDAGLGSGRSKHQAQIYGEHFGPLCQRVLGAARTPALWGDMLLEHPTATSWIPKETLIFDWQYRRGVRDSAEKLLAHGYEVVGCPTLHTYNAAWLHLPESERNTQFVVSDSKELDLYGVCLTTWECALFGSYDALVPAVEWAGRLMSDPSELAELRNSTAPSGSNLGRAYSQNSEAEGDWAHLMGIELQNAEGIFAFSSIRSSLKCRFLLYGNPFLLWMHHAEELCGSSGDVALEILDQALAVAPGDAERGISQFVKSAIEFVRLAEEARLHYADGDFVGAIAKLAPTRMIFDDLAKIARRTHERIGGSLADIERCRVAKEHAEKVLVRIRKYGDGSLGYLPAFEIITHPKFMPHDQGSWWLINSWANE